MADLLAKLKRHADRYGPEGVMEAARTASDFHDGQLEFDELVELQTHIDGLSAGDKWAKKHRLSAETRVKRLLGIDETEAAA